MDEYFKYNQRQFERQFQHAHKAKRKSGWVVEFEEMQARDALIRGKRQARERIWAKIMEAY